MNQGDIVLVPFPFTDLTSIKLRPALVISQTGGEDFIILAITSQKRKNSIKIIGSDLKSGGLPLDSYVLWDKVVTLDKTLIRKNVGSLKKEVIKIVLTKFKAQF